MMILLIVRRGAGAQAHNAALDGTLKVELIPGQVP